IFDDEAARRAQIDRQHTVVAVTAQGLHHLDAARLGAVETEPDLVDVGHLDHEMMQPHRRWSLKDAQAVMARTVGMEEINAAHRRCAEAERPVVHAELPGPGVVTGNLGETQPPRAVGPPAWPVSRLDGAIAQRTHVHLLPPALLRRGLCDAGHALHAMDAVN